MNGLRSSLFVITASLFCGTGMAQPTGGNLNTAQRQALTDADETVAKLGFLQVGPCEVIDKDLGTFPWCQKQFDIVNGQLVLKDEWQIRLARAGGETVNRVRFGEGEPVVLKGNSVYRVAPTVGQQLSQDVQAIIDSKPELLPASYTPALVAKMRVVLAKDGKAGRRYDELMEGQNFPAKPAEEFQDPRRNNAVAGAGFGFGNPAGANGNLFSDARLAGWGNQGWGAQQTGWANPWGGQGNWAMPTWNYGQRPNYGAGNGIWAPVAVTQQPAQQPVPNPTPEDAAATPQQPVQQPVQQPTQQTAGHATDGAAATMTGGEHHPMAEEVAMQKPEKPKTMFGKRNKKMNNSADVTADQFSTVVSSNISTAAPSENVAAFEQSCSTKMEDLKSPLKFFMRHDGSATFISMSSKEGEVTEGMIKEAKAQMVELHQEKGRLMGTLKLSKKSSLKFVVGLVNNRDGSFTPIVQVIKSEGKEKTVYACVPGVHGINELPEMEEVETTARGANGDEAI